MLLQVQLEVHMLQGQCLAGLYGESRKKKKMPAMRNHVCANVSLESLYRESLDFDFPERAADDKKEWPWEDRRFMKVMDGSCVWTDGHYQVDLPFVIHNRIYLATGR